MGTFIYFVGFTISFSALNDFDNFVMRTNKNLDMHFVRILKNEGVHEYLNTIVLSKSEEKHLYMAGKIVHTDFGVPDPKYKGLIIDLNLDDNDWTTFKKKELGA